MDVSDRAQQLHWQVIVIDGHSDILLPVVSDIATLDREFPVEANANRCLLATSVDDIRRAKDKGAAACILTMEGSEPIWSGSAYHKFRTRFQSDTSFDYRTGRGFGWSV